MSLIFMFFYWVIFPAGIVLGAWWLFIRANTLALKWMAVLAGVAVFAGYLWVAVGEIWVVDQKVKELCKKDGGVKIYETALVTPDVVDDYGIIRIPKKNELSVSDRYYYETSMSYIMTGSPEVWRINFKVYRNADDKLLGESVRYGRRGGGVSGPWHETSFGCPDHADITDLKKAIFTNNGG